jgi:hypothetical protein
VDESKPLPRTCSKKSARLAQVLDCSARSSRLTSCSSKSTWLSTKRKHCVAVAAWNQGLTLVHFSARCKRFLWATHASSFQLDVITLFGLCREVIGKSVSG